jgi:hypothetical protein
MDNIGLPIRIIDLYETVCIDILQIKWKTPYIYKVFSSHSSILNHIPSKIA